MKLEAPKNANYAATIVQVRHINELAGCDNVVGLPLLGYQAIVSKDIKVGDIGVLFTAETKLSDAFLSINNLYRHGDRNVDPGQTGYIEDSGRVKALKFRGHQSDALFLPLDSLSSFVKIDQLNEGDVFDNLDGKEICRKYLVKEPSVQTHKNVVKAFSRVDKKFLPEHYDTDNYFRNSHLIPQDADVVVTQKLHGTSIRIGHTLVQRTLSWKERLARKLGIKVQETEYDIVYGSRKVIKDANNPGQNHFYETDLWSTVGARFADRIPENFIVYGEVIGWINETPIQKNYTYGLPVGENELYVYRVALITNQGKLVDLSWEAVKEFCTLQGIKYTPELAHGVHHEFRPEVWMDKQYAGVLPQAVPLDMNKKFVDEGVCIRVEGLAPRIMKAKSPIFLQHESKMLDEEVVDTETEGSA